MAADFVLEACVDSLDSALAAKEGGATRLELCANLLIGGTTPMPSLVRRVKAATGLPTHALLRPRFGDFLYTGEEFSLLLEDAAALLEAGADAIVSGFLTPAGDLDRQRLAQLVELCHRAGKRFTLHRAFDMCRDPFAALEQCGVPREGPIQEKAELYDRLAELNRQIRAERRKLDLCRKTQNSLPRMEQEIDKAEARESEVRTNEHRRR